MFQNEYATDTKNKIANKLCTVVYIPTGNAVTNTRKYEDVLHSFNVKKK